MSRTLKIAIALFCLFMVVAILIAPNLDLPETTLRSLRIMAALFMAVACLALLFALPVLHLLGMDIRRSRRQLYSKPLSGTRLLTSVQRC